MWARSRRSSRRKLAKLLPSDQMLSIRFKDGMGQIMRGIYREVISEHWHIFKRTVRMPEDISKQFRKKISLKEFEVTNTANNGGEYSQGWDVKKAAENLKIKVLL